MATGAITYEKAVDMAVADFLAQGINCIEYKDGRRVNIADYVRMVLRTTSTRTALQGKAESWKLRGYDTVQVSSYGMCSKTCLPWQGRAYINDAFTDWQGETKLENGVKFGKSLYCGKWFPLLSSAIEHGLFHPNCRHSINLYIEGVTNLTEPMDNSEIERRYKAEQAQRALEREVRKAKRKLEGSLAPEDVKKAKDELREAQKNVRDHINKTNADEGTRVLVRKPLQEKIYGEAPPRISSSADPYEPPRKPVQSTEGFAAEVNIPAPENQNADYTGEKIPQKSEPVGAEEGETVLKRGYGKEKGYEGEKPVPINDKPYTDVTQEYLDNATPGEGKYTVDEGCVGEHYESEKDFAKWVHETFGGDINVNVEKQEKHGVSNPDYLWRGKLWDLKEPEQLTGANGRIRHGLHQIADNPGGVMLDLWKIDNVDYEELQKIIDRRMQWVHGVTVDIMIAYNRTLVKVLRYKK